ncbi:MAG: type II secretion system protein N [Rhodothalassiaceae bacterium]
MTVRRLIILFVLAFSAFALATLPLAVAVSWVGLPGLRAAEISGTIWGGSLRRVAVASHYADQIRLAVRPLHLLAGRITTDLFVDAPGLFAQARLVRPIGGDLWRLRHGRARLDLARLPLDDAPPLLGALDLTVAHMTADGGRCVSAEGEAVSDVLQRSGARFQWQGPTLRGPIRCEAGRLVAALSDGQRIEAQLSVALNGAYMLDISVADPDLTLAVGLTALGFEQVGDRHVLKLADRGGGVS